MKIRLAKALLASAALLFMGGSAQAELIAYYTFEGNANDVSGHGRDGVASGVTTVAGYEGQAYFFNGVPDAPSYVDIPSLDINPSALPRLTMGAWVKWDGTGGCVNQVITHDDGGFDRSLGMDCRFSGWGWAAFNGNGAVTSSIAPTQDWTFLAIVYDQTTSSATLYVNDQSFPTSTSFGPGETYTVIGRNPGEIAPGESGEYFHGIVDNLFFFDEALTAEQVADIRQNGVHTPNTTVVAVDGKASVYQVFGHPGTYDSTSLDAARVDFPAGSNEFQFSVVGGISCCPWFGVGTPDGQIDETHPGWPGPANTAPYNGMSGTVGNVWLGLMGVFTSESDPYGGVPPESLPYDGSNPTSLSPSLNQVFYIGDGQAGRDNPSGELLTFTAPPSASRLYLGFYDGYGGAPAAYHDNSGSMTVTVHRSSMDTTPPLIEANVVGTLGNNGWYVSDVQVAWTVTDPESAISETTGCEASSVTSDTTGMTFTCSATSLGGTTTESVTIKRDTTPPIATATAGPPPNANGWNRTNVTVTFTGTDATSGVESCDPPVILKTNGMDQSASGRCYDFAGIQSDLATASGINIDKTKPTVVITSPTSGAVYSVGQVVLASYACDDTLSGIASCVGTVANGQPIYTSKVSPVRSFKVTGKDAAGNSTSVTVKYAVQ